MHAFFEELQNIIKVLTSKVSQDNRWTSNNTRNYEKYCINKIFWGWL